MVNSAELDCCLKKIKIFRLLWVYAPTYVSDDYDGKGCEIEISSAVSPESDRAK